MTTENGTITCPDVVIINKQCTNYIGQGLCKLPKRVYCILYDGDNRKPLVKSMSPSGIDSYRNCHQKWTIGSFKSISPPETSMAFAAGRVGHMGLAEWYKNGTVDLRQVHGALASFKIRGADDKKIEYTAINIAMLLQNYFEFYPQGEFPDASIEVTLPIVDLNFRGFSLHGFADLWLADKKMVVEHKFLDNLDLTPLAYRTQKICYFASTGADQMIMNLLGKPRTYPKRNESMQDYQQRVYENIKSSPAKHFRRIPVQRSQFDIPAELNKIANLIDEINTKITTDGMDENPSNCQFFTCGYESICLTGGVDESFKVTKRGPDTSLSDAADTED